MHSNIFGEHLYGKLFEMRAETDEENYDVFTQHNTGTLQTVNMWFVAKALNRAV